jgi:hypothetical protein
VEAVESARAGLTPKKGDMRKKRRRPRKFAILLLYSILGKARTCNFEYGGKGKQIWRRKGLIIVIKKQISARKCYIQKNILR